MAAVQGSRSHEEDALAEGPVAEVVWDGLVELWHSFRWLMVGYYGGDDGGGKQRGGVERL